MKCIITVGLSGSGKSTFAKELISETNDWSWEEINRDYYRFSLCCGGVEDWSQYKFTKANEDEVTRQCNMKWSYLTSLKTNIIISNTNLKQKDIDYWWNKAIESGYEVEVKYFDTTLEEAFKRDSNRGALSVGREVLIKQWENWLKLTKYTRYVGDDSKAKAIILDIDGTIALVNGRSHYDYSEAVLTDKPRLDVINMVSGYASSIGADIIVVSGRKGGCKHWTKEWLDTYLVDYIALHMRPEGDSRNDRIIKQEIFWNDIAPYYNVVAAFDDRPRVIRLWNDLDIPLVVSVQKGYNEF